MTYLLDYEPKSAPKLKNKLKRGRIFLLILALLLIVLSWWGVLTARTGIIMRSLQRDSIPMLYVAPQTAEKMPGVLVAHGFAGSKQIMLGYAHALAHAGYAVMLWDFGGHGANTKPLERGSLQHDLNIAYTALLAQPGVDATRIALLGHSMGSGAVMSAGIDNVDRFAATVAVSPTGASVTTSAPRNLQLQAGSGEGNFIGYAQRLLKQAGGENQDLTQGKGRSLIIIPKVEHITILFSNDSYQAAREWLDRTFYPTRANASPPLSNGKVGKRYVDRRMIWYGLHLLGWLLLLAAIAPIFAAITTFKVSPILNWGGLLFAPFVTSGILKLLSRGGEINNLGGLMVGGAIAIWFFFAGITWLGILSRLPRPTFKAVGIGAGLFALLWVGFGAMAQVVWLQWWLIPSRLQLWPLLSLGCLPWFIASGVAQQNSGIFTRVALWLGQSAVLVGGFWLTIKFVPNLQFVFILLPLFPIFTAMFSFIAAQLKDVWSYAIGCALFFGWVITAAFPLAMS